MMIIKNYNIVIINLKTFNNINNTLKILNLYSYPPKVIILCNYLLTLWAHIKINLKKKIKLMKQGSILNIIY